MMEQNTLRCVNSSSQNVTRRSSRRFPQLFPPLKPEVVAQKTVEAVRGDKAFLYLPWTMHALVFLKR